MLKVRLFKPWSVEHFLAAMPTSVKSIAVLDRTKEDLASSIPLHADVLTLLREGDMFKKVVCGNYGLGSKEFAPSMLRLSSTTWMKSRQEFTSHSASMMM